MNPILYLLMRNDLPSMNPGKLAAQAAHVANKFIEDIRDQKTQDIWSYFNDMLKEWQGDRGFGTTITLGIDGHSLACVNERNIPDDSMFGPVSDPTYPMLIPFEAGQALKFWGWKDDDNLQLYNNIILNEENQTAILLRDELVGAYLFGDKESLSKWDLINNLSLYP